jgi:hypothetical protein
MDASLVGGREASYNLYLSCQSLTSILPMPVIINVLMVFETLITESFSKSLLLFI